MKSLLIIKTGSTLPEIAARKGDFEHWIMAGLGLPAGAMRVHHAQHDTLPAYETCSAVVITGSHSMVTEHAPWSEGLAEWIPGLIARRIPTLGVCYGHQLLAYALGGTVADNPEGPEYGTVPLTLRPAGATDPLLGGHHEPLYAHVSHFQSVLRLPEGAILLAASEKDPHQAFVVADCAWGLQFHPEFDKEIVAAYIRAYAMELECRGINPSARLDTCRETPDAARILTRFGQLIEP